MLDDEVIDPRRLFADFYFVAEIRGFRRETASDLTKALSGWPPRLPLHHWRTQGPRECASRGLLPRRSLGEGGVEGAKNAALSLMVGGDEAALARVMPVLTLLGKRITHMGGVGSGQATKAVNQVIIAGIAQGVCEALALAEKLDLPTDKLLSVLTGGAANSWFLEKRGETMLKDEFASGFKLGLLLKDLNIVASMGRGLGLSQTVVQQSISDYTTLVAQGRGDEEISALIRKKRGA